MEFSLCIGLLFKILKYEPKHNMANKIIPNVLQLASGECTYSRGWGRTLRRKATLIQRGFFIFFLSDWRLNRTFFMYMYKYYRAKERVEL